MKIVVREAGPEDVERILPFQSVTGEPVTAEEFARREVEVADWDQARFIGVTSKGETVAYGHVSRRPNAEEKPFSATITVLDPWRGRRIGGEILQRMTAFVQKHGGSEITGSVADTDEGARRFLDANGIEVTSHTFASVLDPRQADMAPFRPIVDRLEREGLRFVPFSETDRGERAMRNIHEVNVLCVQDEPAFDGSEWTFADFRHDVFESKWFRPEGQILAMDGEVPLGLGAVGEVSPGIFSNMFTGVVREARGRGIATALKILTIEVAARLGATEVRTENDSRNAPMIAVNRKLGYIPKPGWLRVRKEILRKEI
ncbi:MAG: GNAT family N-acetyltransferase [Fimbriimonas sp.]